MYTKKLQRLFGLRESKTFEFRGKTSSLFNFFEFNYYSGRSKAINVLLMVLHLVFIFLEIFYRNYAFSSAGNYAINTIPQICIENTHNFSTILCIMFFMHP